MASNTRATARLFRSASIHSYMVPECHVTGDLSRHNSLCVHRWLLHWLEIQGILGHCPLCGRTSRGRCHRTEACGMVYWAPPTRWNPRRLHWPHWGRLHPCGSCGTHLGGTGDTMLQGVLEHCILLWQPWYWTCGWWKIQLFPEVPCGEQPAIPSPSSWNAIWHRQCVPSTCTWSSAPSDKRAGQHIGSGDCTVMAGTPNPTNRHWRALSTWVTTQPTLAPGGEWDLLMPMATTWWWRISSTSTTWSTASCCRYRLDFRIWYLMADDQYTSQLYAGPPTVESQCPIAPWEDPVLQGTDPQPQAQHHRLAGNSYEGKQNHHGWWIHSTFCSSS